MFNVDTCYNYYNNQIIMFLVITEFLLYSQQTSIRGRIFNNVTSGFNDAIPPIRSKGSKFIALDFDAHENYIYYSDILQGVVYKINKNGTGENKYIFMCV